MAKKQVDRKLARRSSLASLWNSRKLKWRLEQLRLVGTGMANDKSVLAVVNRSYEALPLWARKGLKRQRTLAVSQAAKTQAEA